MTPQTEAVRRDIERTRAELGATLEELGDRVAPKKVVARTKANVAGKVDDVKERVSPRRNVQNLFRKVRTSVMGAADNIPTPSLPSRSGNGSAPLRRLRDEAGGLTDRAAEVAGSAADRVRQAPEAAKGNPLLAGVVAFGAGFLAASTLPPTDREKRLAREAKQRIEPLQQQAIETGKVAARELQRSAQSGAERVKQRALVAAEDVKEEVQEVSERTKTRAQSASRDVASTAKGATRQVKGTAKQASREVKGEAKQAVRTTKAKAAGGSETAGRPTTPRSPSTTRRPATGRVGSSRAPSTRATAGTTSSRSPSTGRRPATASPGTTPKSTVAGRPRTGTRTGTPSSTR